MFEVGQQVYLTVNFHIQDENEEYTGEYIPVGSTGSIDEDLDFGFYLVSFDKHGLFEMNSGILEPAETDA